MLEQYLEKRDKDSVKYLNDSLVNTYISSCSTAILLNVTGEKSKSCVQEKVKLLKKRLSNKNYYFLWLLI